MVPPAPPTFSTITGWPSDFLMPSATTRARMSEPPPAGNGTIIVTCFDGKLCARAAVMPAEMAIASASAVRISTTMLQHRPVGEPVSLDLYAVGLDDRPPLVEF